MISKPAGSTAVCDAILTGQVPDMHKLPLHKHLQTAVEGLSIIPGEGKTSQAATQALDSSKMKSL